MIEAILMKLGFSGVLSVALAVALLGLSGYTKLAISSRDTKIAEKTLQVQTVAAERDQLLNANRAYTRVVASQNESIENFIRQSEELKGRVAKANQEAEKTKDEWNKFLDHLNQSSAQGGDRWELYGSTYNQGVKKWNTKDLDHGTSETP